MTVLSLGGVCFGLYSRLMAYLVSGLCFVSSLFVAYFEVCWLV
jgi:hypothetical protein